MRLKKLSTWMTGLLVLFALTAVRVEAAALEPIVLSNDKGVPTTTSMASWYYDTSGHHSFDEIVAKKNAGDFKAYASEGIPFVYAHQPFWLYFSVRNESALTKWFLSGNSPILEDVEIYERSESGWNKLPLMPGKRYVTSEVYIPSGATHEYFFKFATYDPLQDLLGIRTEGELDRRDAEELPFHGMMGGIFFAIILYNTFLYFSLRRRLYLFYILFASANAAIALCAANIPVGFFHTFSMVKWGHFLRFLAPLTTFFFAKELLETRINCPRVHRSMDIIIGIYAALLVYQAVTGDQEPLNLGVDILMMAGIVVCFSAGIQAWRKGNAPAKYFLMAMSVFFLGVIIVLLHPVLGLPSNLYTLSAHIIGQAAEMILMSLALASMIKAIEEKKVRAEATVLTKSKLLRVMSHDIMNPLTIIKGFSQIMLRKPGNPEHVDKVLRSANIIENIVQFVVKYESRRGGHTIQLVPVSLREVFDELAFLVQKPLMEKGIKLSFEIDGELEVMAEKISLTNEILANLISNAIKFSFVGSAVEVKAVAQKEHVVVTVKDSGIGIPKDMLSKLFDSTTNISRRGTSGELGAGFGMPIVWSFVKELGGDLAIESIPFADDQVQAGTKVTLTLKRARSNI